MGRVAFLVLLLCAIVCAQALVPGGEHARHHSPDACCLLCGLGPLVLAGTRIARVAAPVFALVWQTACDDPAAPPSAVLPIQSSRAPPVRLFDFDIRTV